MQKSLIMKTLEPPNLKGDSTFSQIYLQEHHRILMMEGEVPFGSKQSAFCITKVFFPREKTNRSVSDLEKEQPSNSSPEGFLCPITWGEYEKLRHTCEGPNPDTQTSNHNLQNASPPYTLPTHQQGSDWNNRITAKIAQSTDSTCEFVREIQRWQREKNRDTRGNWSFRHHQLQQTLNKANSWPD